METKLDFTRQHGIFQPSTQRLNIIIIGAGCTGSYTTECLVRLGFENVTVIDFDKVEKINIPAQTYGLEDLDMLKTDALKKRIKRDTGIEIKTINKMIDKDNKFLDMVEINLDTLVIMAVDNIEARKQIYEELKDIPIKIIDTRFGGTGICIYVLDMENEEDKKKYELILEKPASDQECGRKSTVYCVLNIASEIVNIVKQIDQNQEHVKSFKREMNNYKILSG